MANRKFEPQAERDIALCYLCGVGPGNRSFDINWQIKESTIPQTILKRTNWQDDLVDVYKGRNKAANAIHLYFNGMNEEDRPQDMQGGLIDSDFDVDTYQKSSKVVRDFFRTKENKTIEDMGLSHMFNNEPSGYEMLERVATKNYPENPDNQASDLLSPVIHEELLELYDVVRERKDSRQFSGYGLKSATPEDFLNRAYENAKIKVCTQLGEAWRVFQHSEVQEVVSQNRKELENNWNGKLRILDYREREILKLRFGLNEGTMGQKYSLEEIGTFFKVSRERVRQIEAKAIRKLEQMGD